MNVCYYTDIVSIRNKLATDVAIHKLLIKLKKDNIPLKKYMYKYTRLEHPSGWIMCALQIFIIIIYLLLLILGGVDNF